MMRVKIAEIDIQGCQSRMATCGDTVTEYAELIEGGTKLPPVDLYHDGATYWCADGIHRILAAKKLKHEDIAATIHKGTKADALWHAAGANKTHGLHRSNEDKKRAVELALSLQPNMSVALIAEHVGVHPNTVTKYRKTTITICEGCEDGQSAKPAKPVKRVGRDGIVRTVKSTTPAPEKSEPPPAEPEAFTVKDADAPYASLIHRYGVLYTDLTALKDSPRGGYLRDLWLTIDRAHLTVVDNIKNCRPKELCPKCSGEGCRECSKTGHITLADKRNRRK